MRVQFLVAALSVGFATASSAGEWVFKRNQSDFDRSETIAVTRDANRASNSKWSYIDSALLTIRCKKNELSILIVFPSSIAVGNFVDIGVRVGDAAPRFVKTDLSDNQKATGWWDTKSSAPVLDEMEKSADIAFQIKTPSFGTFEALFALDGLADAVKPVREACRRK
jgi:hypothetical protein